ncbi:P-loop containing nucleoside triphosphate hydrolase protein, partial [Obelidium mucronatum]
LAQAKTGTGKTLGFLIPSIERVYRAAYSTNPPNLPHPNSVSILVISPTRELAQQIAVEAEQLVRFLPLQVQCVIGGTNMSSEAKKLNAVDKRVDILIATPGRLKDHLENSNLKAGCLNLQVLIFDEADRLLDEGFKQDIDKILTFLPKAISPTSTTTRQTLLFSATIPQSVHAIAKQALLPNFKFITTIAEYESSTHEHVPQHQIVVPMQDMLTAAYGILNQILSTNTLTAKIIMFFPTARTTQLFAELLMALKIKCPVFEIHSRKSQSVRTKATDAFRTCAMGIMVSSDVSARGMDFPGVTHVLQVGVPANREQYIHRLGRTARAGTAGTGILLLGDFESSFLTRQLRDLPLKPYPYPNPISPTLTLQVQAALENSVAAETKDMAYQAWLGFYNTWCREFGWKTKDELVVVANQYAMDCLRCERLPGLLKKTVGKMGLKGVSGLNIVSELGGASVGGESRGGSGRGRGNGGPSRGSSGGARGGAIGRGDGASEANDTRGLYSTPVPGNNSGRGGSNGGRGTGMRGNGRGSGRGRGRQPRGGGGGDQGMTQ